MGGSSPSNAFLLFQRIRGKARPALLMAFLGLALAASACAQDDASKTKAEEAPAAGAVLNPAVPRSRSDLTYSYSSIVKKAAPAVVNVYVQQNQMRRRNSDLYNDPFYERFFGRERPQNSLGSGVIVAPNGIVVTNNHVIQVEGEANIKVSLADSREFAAKVIFRDERTDLAVLRIEGGDKDFPYLSFADSDQLEVGDIVLAIGNPFGVGQTVTSGIVSAVARTRVGVSDYQFFIQTDAAINPGNSGGPLVDMNGQIAGINTAIFTRSGGSQGIGFAIPANMVRVVVNSALHGGKLERPWLGAELQAITADIAEAAGLDRPTGALVSSVADSGPAAKAGLKPGDVIVSVDGREAKDPQSVLYRFVTKGVGAKADVEFVSRGKKRTTVVELVAAPETVSRDTREIDGSSPFTGATLSNLSPAVAEELSIKESEGVVVVETKAYSPARRFGLQPGDIITRFNGVAVESVKQFGELLSQSSRGWDFTIRRGGIEQRVLIRR